MGPADDVFDQVPPDSRRERRREANIGGGSRLRQPPSGMRGESTLMTGIASWISSAAVTGSLLAQAQQVQRMGASQARWAVPLWPSGPVPR